MDQGDLQERLLVASDNAKDEKELLKLLKEGVDINCSDLYGLTPLMRAALFNSSAKVIQALVEAGSDVYAREPQYKSTALQLAANHNPHAQIIEALVDAGSDVHDINYLGETALIMAVNSGNDIEVIAALIKAGSDVNARDYQDRSALDYAKMNRQSAVIKLLRDNGAR
ncbi:MAG: ankyrin repeat domain-containing protein [Sphaerochaetaceae bacterium]